MGGIWRQSRRRRVAPGTMPMYHLPRNAPPAPAHAVLTVFPAPGHRPFPVRQRTRPKNKLTTYSHPRIITITTKPSRTAPKIKGQSMNKTVVNPCSGLRAGLWALRQAAHALVWRTKFTAQAWMLGFELRHGLPIVP